LHTSEFEGSPAEAPQAPEPPRRVGSSGDYYTAIVRIGIKTIAVCGIIASTTIGEWTDAIVATVAEVTHTKPIHLEHPSPIWILSVIVIFMSYSFLWLYFVRDPPN
jgi:hypothetical protein